MRKQIGPFRQPLSRRGKALAVLLASCCAAILYSRVYLDFERIRVGVVLEEMLPSEGSVMVPLPDLSELDGQATAIILRLANGRAEPMPARILVGNVELARFVVGSQRVARVDLSVRDGAPLAQGNLLELEGDGDRWSLKHLEIANAHGFSRGLLAFVIVPASAEDYKAAPGLGVALLFVALLTLPSLSSQFEGRKARIANATSVAIILSLFGVVLLAPILSDYELLLSPQAFLLCTAGLYVPALLRLLSTVPAAVVLLDSSVQRWWAKPVNTTTSAAPPSWDTAGARRRFKLVVSFITLWLLSHAGNFLAGAEFLPPSRPSADRNNAVAASDLEAYRCLGCSVVLISIDTLRADHLGSYGYPRPTSPAIDEFADAATLFSTTIAPGSSTLMSHASMMTSLLTLQHDARVRPAKPLADEALTLAEVLQGTGYQTAAFTAGGQLNPIYGLTQGFDLYDSQTRRDFQGTVDASMAWLDEEPRGKFFLFMHTYEVHAPYTPHDRYWELLGADEGTGLPVHVSVQTIDELNMSDADGRPSFTDADVRHVVRAYDAEIRSVDDAFAGLLRELKRRGEYDDVLVILTSDHGEEFGEHGRVGHHAGSGFDEILKVPLIIKFPRGAFSSITVNSQVRTIDIAPTIVDAVGGMQPSSFAGSPLVDVIAGDDEMLRTAISEASEGVFAIRTDRWKYLQGQLYALGADPMERQDLAQFFPAVRSWMESQRGMLALLPRLGSAETIVPSEEALRELRALGYIR